MSISPAFIPGDRVAHVEFGTGIVLEAPRDGFVRTFFKQGERRVPALALRRERSRAERILSSVSADPGRPAVCVGDLAGTCPTAAGECCCADIGKD